MYTSSTGRTTPNHASIDRHEQKKVAASGKGRERQGRRQIKENKGKKRKMVGPTF
jgi:hypothetical protein